MTDQSPLVLVDGSSYVYRAYHALPKNLATHDGRLTNAVYGVFSMLRKLINDYQPSHMAVVFDAKGPTFRNELYAEYKAHRPPMPDELREQIEPLHALVQAYGLPMPVIEGVEADDVIGTLAREAAAAGHDVVISTGDKDMAQLVDERITLVNTMTGTCLDRDGVIEKFGVPPERIIDLLALMGDSSDNIPGVEKCGPKTAVKWLKEYGDLDSIMARADTFKGKIGENLRAALEHLPLSRQLATILTDVELAFRPEDLQRGEPDVETLRELYADLEFRTWLAELQAGGDADPAGAAPQRDYEIVVDPAHFETWRKRLEAAELFAFDTETTSLDYMQAEIVGVSFAVQAGAAAYVPLAHRDPDLVRQLDREQILAALKPLLEDPQRPKVLQNAKYDAHVLANHGIKLAGVAHDTMLESYVLDSTATRHDMDSLALRYLDEKTIHYQDIAGKGAKQLRFDDIPVAQAGPYAAEDADITLRLHQTLWPRLEAESGLAELYRNIEIPLIDVLVAMEHTGVLVDRKMLAAQSAELAKQLLVLESEAHKVAEGPFNLGSPKQIQEVLYERMGLPVRRKTPKGQPSTAEDVLQELAEDYELPALILQHRGLSKLKSTYTDKLGEIINPNTGRVHTSYHQAVASTGRLSSSDPNLQNIPIRTEAGRRIRKAFVVPDGAVMLAADYSQIELRIMAHLSRDEGLLKAFAAGQDIHRATAAEVFGGDPETVSTEQRRAAKAINFGLIYGMSAFGLARQLKIDRGEAQDYVERYFARYPGVKAYMDETRRLAAEQGYVETVFGRRLYLRDINARNGQLRAAAERTAINAPMQGTAADIIKRAMITVHRRISTHEGLRLIMQVHDELILEVDENAVEKARELVRECMQGAAELRVPLLVEIGTGSNWDQAH